MGIRRSEELIKSDFNVDRGGNPMGGTTWLDVGEAGMDIPLLIHWQKGVVPEGEDQNGAFVEDVLEAARQRLYEFQEHGKFNCRENAVAITKIEEALMWLDWRTRRRTLQGVENTYESHS